LLDAVRPSLRETPLQNFERGLGLTKAGRFAVSLADGLAHVRLGNVARARDFYREF
jgi:hypothetical protein